MKRFLGMEMGSIEGKRKTFLKENPLPFITSSFLKNKNPAR